MTSSSPMVIPYGSHTLRLRGLEPHEIPPVPTPAVLLEHPPRPAGTITSAGQKSTDHLHRTRPQGEWEGVWWFSVEPGEIGLTALEGAGDGINQHGKDR